MIARDKELTEEQKERQREALRAVLRYCSNKVDCRRTQVLSFFGEHFDPKRCNNTCDVCLSRGTEPMEMVDVTEKAKTIIQLVAAIPKPNKRKGDKMSDGDWTMPQAVECLKGLKGRSGKPLDDNPCFGKGSSWDRGDHERLFEYLLIENILGENYKENNMGFSNAYMTVRLLLVPLVGILLTIVYTLARPQVPRCLERPSTMHLTLSQDGLVRQDYEQRTWQRAYQLAHDVKTGRAVERR